MVAFSLRLLETLYVGRRYNLDFRGRDAIEIRRGFSVDDTDLDFSRRIPTRDICSPLVFFRRITADHKSYSNHHRLPLAYSIWVPAPSHMRSYFPSHKPVVSLNVL